MGTRIKTFVATGVAPNGRLYAGDLNAIEDQYADLNNLGQTLGVGTIQVGETGLQLVRFGAGEARITGALRTDGILRGLGGLFAGTFTTTQRNAITSPPFGLMILNTTTNQFEWNAGTPSVPSWAAIAPAFGAGSVTNSMLAANAVDSSKIADGSIVFADISGTLKPSVSAADTDESLRRLGTAAGQAYPGNGFATTPDAAVYGAGPSGGGTYTVNAPVAGTYIVAWGAGMMISGSQGSTVDITCSVAGGAAHFGDVGGSGGPVTVPGIVLTAGQVVTFTIATTSGATVQHYWARLTRTA